jgi:hypothetical protein
MCGGGYFVDSYATWRSRGFRDLSSRFFRPFGALQYEAATQQLALWAVFFRRYAAGVVPSGVGLGGGEW